MASHQPVDLKLLEDLLELHSLGESIVWPPGYSLERARKELSGGELALPAPAADLHTVANIKKATPVRANNAAKSTQPATDEIRVYTDGSCPSNVGSAAKQGAAGWGFVVLRGEEVLDFYGPVEFDKANPLFLGCTCGTNNTGELSAIGMALRWLVEADLSSLACTIFYDSKYAANIAQAIWKAEKNEDLARTVQGFFRVAKAARSIAFKHVKGHSGDQWNERADKNANQGASGGLQCWQRPPTPLYKPKTTLQSMFAKRPAPNVEGSSKKPRQASGIAAIMGTPKSV